MRRHAKKKNLFAMFIVALVTLALYLSVTHFMGTESTKSNNPSSTPPADTTNNKSKGPLLIVPENPTGVLGTVVTSISALGAFAFFKIQRN